LPSNVVKSNKPIGYRAAATVDKNLAPRCFSCRLEEGTELFQCQMNWVKLTVC